MIREPELRGWQRLGPRLVRGPEPRGTWTLRALADAKTDERCLERLLDGFPELTGRTGTLTLLHYALHAVGNVVIAPLVLDGAAVEITAGELGVVTDDRADIAAFWVGQAAVAQTDDPVRHAAPLAMRLVEPIAETVRRTARAGSRAILNITLDSLHASCEWFERAAPSGNADAVTSRFLAEAGHPEHRLGRLIHVQPDTGPPVVLRVPTTCCVLSPEPGCHACPTCPQHADDEARLRIARDWLRSLDDDGFLDVTGRPRS